MASHADGAAAGARGLQEQMAAVYNRFVLFQEGSQEFLCRACHYRGASRLHADTCWLRNLDKAIEAHAEEVARLKADSEILRHANTIEIAVRNESGSVSEYMNHWEGRTLKAEAEVERLRAEGERLLTEMRRHQHDNEEQAEVSRRYVERHVSENLNRDIERRHILDPRGGETR